VLLNIWVIKY